MAAQEVIEMKDEAIPDTYAGFAFNDLQLAFDVVADPEDWKAPIAAQVKGEAVSVVVAAIQFYTATTPKVTLDISTMTYAITSVGYRAGPAA